MDTREYRLGYRADIEGLRAIAILLVVAAHAGVPWLAGGFVGVDVFFVLSGYLITGLLLREIDSTGGLRFANFYARRLRRLLPGLLLMLVCTSALAVIMLAPGEQVAQAMAAATASVWLSNIHFAFAKLDYFSPGAASNLFLHTWSLGVEEQFYLIWPALMVWALGAWRGHGGRSRRLKVVMVVIFAASLFASLRLTDTASQMAFYLMPLRAWQFAAGALIWLHFGSSRTADANSAAPAVNGPLLNWLGWLGLGLIVVSGIWFDANVVYPGWRAMLPALGAAAVIAAGTLGGARGVSRTLSWRPLQALGRVSYSWYLWHWPILLLGRSLFPIDSPLYRFGLVVLSLLLAILSYRLVESPIRRQARWVVRPGVTIAAAAALMLVANALCISWSNAATTWIKSPARRHYAMERADAPIIYRMGCDDWFHSDRVRICAFGPEDARHTAVLMGDSIGAQWFPAVAEVFNRPGWRLLVLTKSSCPMVDKTIFYPLIGRSYVECTTWRAHALQQVAALRPDIVILGSASVYGFDRSQWVEGTARLLKVISGVTGHIYILRGTPDLPFDGPSCLASQSWLPWLHLRQNTCQASSYSLHGNRVYQALQQASQRFGNVTVLDLNDAICPNGMCDAERKGKVVFRDSQHMTATFADSLSGELAHQLNLESQSARIAHARM